jgi:hypothetical protein
VASDADDLSARLRRIAELTERLGAVQADSVKAQQLSARIRDETARLRQPVVPPKTKK